MGCVIRLDAQNVQHISTQSVEDMRVTVPKGQWSEFLEDVTFALTRDMAAIARAIDDQDGGSARALAGQLQHAAAGVGLHELAYVSKALADVIDRRDVVASAALAKRLMRVGSASLVALVGAERGETPTE